MAQVISSVGTITNPTGHSQQTKIIFDGTRFWAFYMKSGTANTLFYTHSTDLISWTESSVALASGTSQDGSNMSVLWDSSNSLVLVSFVATDSYDYGHYIRGVISGTSISWGTTDRTISGVTSVQSVIDLIKDSVGYPCSLADYGTNEHFYYASSVLSSTFSAINWTDLNPSGNSGNCKSLKAFALASQHFLLLDKDDDTGGYACVRSQYWNGSGWSDNPSAIPIYVTAPTDFYFHWDAVRISDDAVFCCTKNGASTIALYRTTDQGVNWTARTAPSWPSSGLAANSEITLCTNGTDIYLVVIRGDASCSVSYNKYTVASNTWDGWTDLITGGTQTRKYINSEWLNGQLVVLYTQTNGSNYDLTIEKLSSITITQEGFRFSIQVE
jgi:hypothetical protein